MNKPFVSVYFTPDHLQILQLNRSGKVNQVASVALPSGLIAKHIVNDTGTLAKILRTTWKKLGIKERSVGLIIPEFITLTKLITVPKLTGTELGEAVQWQIQEFLPYGFSDAIADWKIAKKGESDIDVLSVIAPKKALLGYVDASEAAGLFPILVTNPSVALTSVVNTGGKGELIVFRSEHEGLVLLKEGHRVFASAVVTGNSFEEVIKTVKRISNHYSEIKTEKIFLGGTVSEQEVELLKGALKLPVEWINVQAKGLSKEAFQEYLIPVCTQYISAFEPLDVNTINLLPPPLIMKYNSARRRTQVWGLTLFITLFVWLCFFVVLGTYFYLNNQIMSVKVIDISKNTLRQDAINKVKEINSITGRVGGIQDINVFPETVFSEISGAGVEGVKFTSYKFDFDKGKITLRGIAADRSKLITFKSNLEAIPTVSSVTIPISNLEAETDVEFSITYDYLPITKNLVEKK